MAKKRRAEEKESQPRLKTIEVLAWAAARDVFTLNDAALQFASRFGPVPDDSDSDPETLRQFWNPLKKDILERFRKLVRSKMILSVTPDSLDALIAQGSIDHERKGTFASRMAEILDGAQGRGRKPRCYYVTHWGHKYAAKRVEDDPALGEDLDR